MPKNPGFEAETPLMMQFWIARKKDKKNCIKANP